MWDRISSLWRGGSPQRQANQRQSDQRPTDNGEPANNSTPPSPRLVIDTNIFVAAVRAPRSSSRRVLEAVEASEATLLVSQPVFKEYRMILSRALGGGSREALARRWVGMAETVNASRGPRIVAEDPDDDKFVELALHGGADAIITNDRHLHDCAGQIAVPVLRPGQAVREFLAMS